MAKEILEYRIISNNAGKNIWLALVKLDDSHSAIRAYKSENDMNEDRGAESISGQFASTDNPDKRMDEAEKKLTDRLNPKKEKKEKKKGKKKGCCLCNCLCWIFKQVLGIG